MLTLTPDEAQKKIEAARSELRDRFVEILSDDSADLPDVGSACEVEVADDDVSWLRQMDWRSDPLPVKWDKLRAVFLNAYGPEVVFEGARSLKFKEWLDYAIKLMQRPTESMPMQITAIRVELPGGYTTTVEAQVVGTDAQSVDRREPDPAAVYLEQGL